MLSKLIPVIIISAILLSPVLVSLTWLNANPLLLYSLFEDYLKGKNSGIVTINIEPRLNGSIRESEYLLLIHNLTAEHYVKHSEVIFSSFMKLPGKVTFKIWRKPVKTLPNGTVLYETQEFLIIVLDLSHGYSSDKIVQVHPNKPISILNVKLNIEPKKRIHSPPESKSKQCCISQTRLLAEGNIITPLYNELIDVEYETHYTKTGIQLHSVPGLSVGYLIKENTVLYFDGYVSDKYVDVCPSPNEVTWSSAGKKSTPPISGPAIPRYLVSDGEKGKLGFPVVYRLEKWLTIYETGGLTLCYYVLVPYNYAGEGGEIYEDVNCTQCNSDPPSYAACFSAPSGYESYIQCGTGGDSAIEAHTAVTFTFYGVSFTLSINWYRYVDIDPFYIYFKTSKSGELCRWHHDNDPASYIAHFTFR